MATDQTEKRRLDCSCRCRQMRKMESEVNKPTNLKKYPLFARCLMCCQSFSKLFPYLQSTLKPYLCRMCVRISPLYGTQYFLSPFRKRLLFSLVFEDGKGVCVKGSGCFSFLAGIFFKLFGARFQVSFKNTAYDCTHDIDVLAFFRYR